MPRVNCEHCRRLFTLRAGLAPASARCPFCQKKMAVPRTGALPAITPPALLADAHSVEAPAAAKIDASALMAQLDELAKYVGLLSLHEPLAPAGKQANKDFPETNQDTRAEIQDELSTPGWQLAAVDLTLDEALAVPDVPMSTMLACNAQKSIEEAVAPSDTAEIRTKQSHHDPEVQHSFASNRRHSFWVPWVAVFTSVLLTAAMISGLMNSKQEPGTLQNPARDQNAEEQEQTQGSLTRPSSTWQDQFIDELNRHRKCAGMRTVRTEATLDQGCIAHAKYLAQNVKRDAAAPSNVYKEDASILGFSAAGEWIAGVALISYAEPMHALERWMGRLFSRVQLLNPDLERIGIGCEQNDAGDWICVVAPVRGQAKSLRSPDVAIFPARDQIDVPCVGFDRLEENDRKPIGFPISATFPNETELRNAAATLMDGAGKEVKIRVSSPERPLNAKLQRTTIGLHPLEPLQPGQSYVVELNATVNGLPWNDRWPFTTRP